MVGKTTLMPIRFRGRWATLAAVLCLMLPGGAAFPQDSQKASPATQTPQPRSGGERVFVDQGCAVCHGLIGHGGVGPALLGDKFLSIGDYVAAQILLGRGQMPAFADRLSDDEIAAVASYIRNSWGNNFGQLSANNVQQQRAKLKKAD